MLTLVQRILWHGLLHRLSCAAPADKSAVCQPSGHPSMPVRRSQATHGPWTRAACGVCRSHPTCSTRIARPQAAPFLVLIGPKILKPSRRQFGVFDSVLDVAMAQEELDGPRILLVISQLKATAMAQLMRVHWEAERGDLARVGHHLPHARVGQRAFALRKKDIRRVGGGAVLQPAQGANLGGG